MKFGIGVIGEQSPEETLGIARRIEAGGLEQIWLADERFYRDVFAQMTLVACHTHRIKIGCMVTDPFVRHPALTAVAAATVDSISGERCVLGLGAGISGFREMGIRRVRPAQALREAIDLINRLTSGEADVTVEGELIQFHGGHLGFTPSRRVPLFVAGRGPRVLQVGGERADGVVVGSFASEHGIRWGLEQAARGARRAGREMRDIETVSWLYTAVSEDGRAAREAVRQGVAVAMWGSREVLPEIGVSLPSAVMSLMEDKSYRFEAGGRLAELAAALPDELLDQFSVAGTPGEVVEKLARVGRLGIQQAALWPFPVAGSDLGALVDRIADEIVPAVHACLG